MADQLKINPLRKYLRKENFLTSSAPDAAAARC